MLECSIDTPRFHLRPLREDDVTERYLEWFEDATARKHITAAAQTNTLDDLRAYIAARRGRADVLFLGIFGRTSGLHIGNIKYEPVDDRARFAVMGILIGDPAYRGTGAGPEVIAASAWWLEANRGIHEIVLGVHRNNDAAIRAYERVGFVVAGTPHLPLPAKGTATMVWRLEEKSE